MPNASGSSCSRSPRSSSLPVPAHHHARNPSLDRGRAGLLVGLIGLLLAGCATLDWRDRDRWHTTQADFYFTNFIGREPAAAQERADGRACYLRAWAWGPTLSAHPRVPVNPVADALLAAGAFGAVSVTAARRMENYEACLRARGYQLEAWELLPSGEWGRR